MKNSSLEKCLEISSFEKAVEKKNNLEKKIFIKMSESGSQNSVAQGDDEVDSADEGLDPIRDGHIGIRNDLRALTSEELNHQTFGPIVGTRGVSGVGLARVEKTLDVNWVYLACNDLRVEFCDRHSNPVPMTLYRVKEDSGVNIAGALFFRCGRKLGGVNRNGYPNICGKNLYLCYSQRQLEAELAHQNPNRRPLMIQDLSKIA
jgi:hypothetical protein